MDTVWAGGSVQSGIHLGGSCGDRKAQFMLLVLSVYGKMWESGFMKRIIWGKLAWWSSG